MSQLKEHLNKSLGARVFVAICAIVLLFAVLLAVWSIASDRKSTLAELEKQARQTARLLWLAVETPLRAGYDRETSVQFKLLGEKFTGSSMSIAGADGIITYSTAKGEIKKSAAGILHPEMAEAYRSSLESRAPSPFIHTQNGRRKLMVFTPIDNEPACYHCHGWSRPVLGAAAAAVDVEDQLSALDWRNIGNAALFLISGLLLSCFSFLAVRAKALARVYALKERSELMAAEFLSFNRGTLGANLARCLREAPSGSRVPDGSAASLNDELAGIARDVEETLLASNGLLLPPLALDSTPAPLVICGRDGSIIHYNRQLTELLGLPPDAGEGGAFCGQPLKTLLGQEAAGRIMPCDLAPGGNSLPIRPGQTGLGGQAGLAGQAGQMSLSGQTCAYVDLELPAASGAIAVRAYVAPIRPGSAPSALENAPIRLLSDQPDGTSAENALGLIIVFCDISALRREAESLRQHNARLAENLRLSSAGYSETFAEAEKRINELSQSSSLLTGQLGHAKMQTASLLDKLENGRSPLAGLNAKLRELFGGTALSSAEASRLQADIRVCAAQTGFMAESIGEIEQSALKVKEYLEGIEKQRGELAQSMQAIQDMADRFNFIALNSAIEASSPTLSARQLRRLADQLRTLAEEAIKNTAEARQQLSAFAEAAKAGLPLADSTAKIAAGGIEQAQELGRELSAHAETAALLAEKSTAMIELAGQAQQSGEALVAATDAEAAFGEQVEKVLSIAENASAGILEQLHGFRQTLAAKTAAGPLPRKTEK